MTKKILALLISIVSFGLPTMAKAEAGASGGLSLLSIGGGRPAALGEAYTAGFNDITAMSYNPASLSTLETGQASFLYQQGLIEDSYGQLMIGVPKERSGFGLSVGYYNGGKIDLVDANGNLSSVTAQRDITAGIGYSHKFGGISAGITAKYLNSNLIGEVTATAYAIDLGVMAPVSKRLMLGAAALNYGTELKYVDAGDPLPRLLRAGGSYLLLPGRANTSLLFDVSYLANEKITTPAVGLETLVGPLALRAGYKSSSGVNEFTAGAGFGLGRASLDYAFGLVNQFDAQHKVSLGMKFGGTSNNTEFVRRPAMKREPVEQVATQTEESAPVAMQVEETPVRDVVESTERRQTLGAGETVLRAPSRNKTVSKRSRQIYIVKAGDTLGSIARAKYGDKRKWQAIYNANRHLIDDPAKIEKGMRIVIP